MILYIENITGNPSSSESDSNVFDRLILFEAPQTHSDPSTLTPSYGDKYTVVSGVGDWSGKDNMIALYEDYWRFFEQQSGIEDWWKVLNNFNRFTEKDSLFLSKNIDTIALEKYNEWLRDQYGTAFKEMRDSVKDIVNNQGLALAISTENNPNTLTPTEGDKYLVGSIPVNGWETQEGNIATWSSSAWSFKSPEAEGFLLQTDAVKLMLCELHIGGFTERFTYLSANSILDKIEVFGDKFDYLATKICRGQIRMRRAESFLIRELPAEAMTIFSEAKDDIDNYLKIGLDGTYYGDEQSGVSDYINDTLRLRPYTPMTMTLSAVCDRLEDILFKGKIN
jgi:hypothetical protein